MAELRDDGQLEGQIDILQALADDAGPAEAAVTGEIVDAELVGFAAVKAASAADQQQRDLERVHDADVHAPARPVGPHDVVVRPFGWTPQGRLAELANRADPDERLSLEAARLVFAGTPKNTRETYSRQWWKFVQWCGQTGRVELPATPATMIEYMNHLWRTPGRYGRPTAPASVALALAVVAIAHHRARRPEADERGHAQYGYVSPTKHPDVQAAMRGYRRQWLSAGHRPDTAYPLSPEEMSQMVATLDGRSVVGVQKAVILCVGYDMGGRRSELAAIDMRDVELHVRTDDPDQVFAGDENGEGADFIIIHVPQSKTDQAGEGDEVFLFAHEEFPDTCPVRWTLRWLAWRREQGIPETGPFLLQIRYGGVGPQDGRPRSGKIVQQALSGGAFEYLLHQVSAAAGLHTGGRRKHIVPHSLRAGSATAAAGRGAQKWDLDAHFRWSTAGTTAGKYVRRGQKLGRNPVQRVYRKRRVTRGGGQ